MSIKSITLISILSIGMLTACESADNAKSQDGINLESITKSKSKNKNAKGGNTCLLAYQKQYDKLLSKEDVLAATGFTEDKLKEKYSKIMDDPMFHSYSYSWKNGRKGPIMGVKGTFELSDNINVSGIEAMSLDDFEKAYRPMTEAENAAAKDALNDIADGDVKDAQATEALDKANKAGVSKEDIKKTGGGVLDMIKSMSEGYTPVEGIGDAASWNIMSNELIVLQDGVTFKLHVEVSNAEPENKKLALQLAQKILDKCK